METSTFTTGLLTPETGGEMTSTEDTTNVMMTMMITKEPITVTGEKS